MDSESVESKPPWDFVPSLCFSEGKAIVGSAAEEVRVEAGKGKSKNPAGLYMELW